MTIMEKFATLTHEQQAKFAAVKDAAALEDFAAEYCIDLTEEEKAQAAEYFETGKLPLDDDDLDAVAGGAAKDISPTLAAADGRIYNLPQGNNICICHHGNKWAREKIPCMPIYFHIYKDVKCYKCGKQWEYWEHQ